MPIASLSQWEGLRIVCVFLSKVCVGFCLVLGCSNLSDGAGGLSY